MTDIKSLLEEEIKEIENEEKEELDTTEKGKPFSVVYNTGLKEGEKPFENVIGHENQKKELLNVINWFNHSKELKAKGVSLPRGVVLFGDPGLGKTLLMKEIIKCCNVPVFVFQGEKNNEVVEGIIETFKRAREAGKAIIVFDELDLLINKERRVVRALQENLDGVESDAEYDLLVLTATNDLDAIPDALIRHGRLEKLIKIPYPTGKEALALFKKHMADFNVALPNGFDDEEVSLSLNGISCAGIKAVVNDLVLRNGFENITCEMIDRSIFNITDRIKSTPTEDNIEVAVHESAHCIVAKQYPQFFDINRLNISGASGYFHAKEVEKDFWPYDKVLADIRICMAGTIGQKVLFGRASRGNESDLQGARISAYNLFNISGYSSCWETLPPIRSGARTETPIKRRRMERKIEKLLKKCEKETYRIVRKNKDKIMELAKLLFEKKHLKSTEILSVIG